MPIRINLKELFSADAQSTIVDKINFNFNKLLELGIGEQGEKGISGIQGAAGPIGLTGDQGTRGSIWYVDSAGDPNSVQFNDLIFGDLYLDSNTFSIWQYDGTQWNFIANLANIINNYLTASPSPFKRGFGIGTPDDSRFILFNKRDDPNDLELGITSLTPSTNDILFLNNFDEDQISPFVYGPALVPISPQVATDDLYNALLSISTDQQASLSGRYHIELGALSLNPNNSELKLTSVYENLKITYNKVFHGPANPNIHSGLDNYNLGVFSLDIPELIINSNRTTNGVFQFIVPKFLNSPSENTRFDIYLGSKYGLDEIANQTTNYVKSDGILLGSGSSLGNVGFIEGHLVPNYPNSNTGYLNNQLSNAYLWLDALDSDGIMIDDFVFQNGGNIVQLGLSEPRQKAITQAALGANSSPDFFARGAISIIGNEVLTVFGDGSVYNLINADLTSKYGYFNKFSIDDPNLPTSEIITNSRFNGAVSGGTTPTPTCNTGYLKSEQPIGPGASDITEDGEYAYVVNSQRRDRINPTFTVSGINYSQTSFQILKKRDKNNVSLKRISRLGVGEERGSVSNNIEINGANRIKLYGKYAIVTTGTLLNWPIPINLSGTDYAGRISAIDISDPYAPRIQASASYSALVNSTVCYMDMDIHDELAVTLTWEQTNGVSTADLQIRLDAFDLGGLKDISPLATPSTASIEWIGKGTVNILNSTGLNSSQLGNAVRYGAVSTDGKRAYAGYGNEIRVFSLIKESRVQDSPGVPPCYFKYDQSLTTTFIRTTSESIVDIKILGNSLYVLASSLTAGRLIKYEVRGGVLTQSWDKAIAQAVSRFEVSGKHIYVAAQGLGAGAFDKNQGNLIVIDFDGFYTAAAHIESLRTEELNITKDIKVGSSANIFGQLNIGGSAQIQGHLGVKTAIQTPFIINDEGNLSIETAGTFDVGAAFSIDMFANQNITLNAGGVTSQLRLLSGYDVELTAANKIDINAVTLDAYVNGNVIINADNASSLLRLRSANDIELIALDRIDVDATTIVDIASADITMTASDDVNITASDDVTITATDRVDLSAGGSSTGMSMALNEIFILASTASSGIQIQSNGSQPSTYGTTGVNLPLKLYGHLSTSQRHNSPFNVSPSQPAIVSGLFQPPGGVDNGAYDGAVKINWQKIGNVIYATGFIQMSGGSTSGSGLIPFPVLGSGAISDVYGTATVFVFNARTVMLPAFAGYDSTVSTTRFYFETALGYLYRPLPIAFTDGNYESGNSPAANVQADLGDGVSNNSGNTERVRRQSNIQFTISYRIS